MTVPVKAREKKEKVKKNKPLKGTHTLASITAKFLSVDIHLYVPRKGFAETLLPLMCVVQRLEARFAA